MLRGFSATLSVADASVLGQLATLPGAMRGEGNGAPALTAGTRRASPRRGSPALLQHRARPITVGLHSAITSRCGEGEELLRESVIEWCGGQSAA